MNTTLTINDIMKAHDEIMKMPSKQSMQNPFSLNMPMHFGGIPVIEAQDRIVPKVQVSEWFADKWLTDEAKKRINDKLIDILGTNVIRPVPKGTMYMFGNSVIARPEDITRMLSVSA